MNQIRRKQKSGPEGAMEGIDVGWSNKILKVRGIVPIVVVMMAGSLFFAGWLLVKQTDAPIKSIEGVTTTMATQHGTLSGILLEQRAATEREHTALIRTQERIADSLDAQVFYLSKTEKERAQYKIAMPDSLRKKLVDRGADDH